VMKSQLLGDMDISEIAIVVSYLLYLVFYFAVFRLWQRLSHSPR
jgi:basic amino acid/polyamine antiporter, APA family